MGVEALTRVFEHAPHNGMELLVLIALANIADPAGVCWPGHEYLGLYARIKHERNLRQYLRALESTGNIYASKVGHRNQKAMYLVATAMNAEEIEKVLTHSFELHIEDARIIANDMVERQHEAESQFPLPLSELRKNKCKSGGPQKRGISRSAKERGISRSVKERRISRSANGVEEKRISRSPNRSGIARSSFENKEGSPDPKRRIGRSVKADQGINLVGRSAASGRAKSRPDPIMIHHDPCPDPPPPEQKTANLDGGGGLSATTLYLQEVTEINANVTEELGDLPLDQVKALVEKKRRSGSQDGGIVIALRALRRRLQREPHIDEDAHASEQISIDTRVEDLDLSRLEIGRAATICSSLTVLYVPFLFKCQFQGYMEANQQFIASESERYRYGKAVAIGFVESTVNQIISKRMVKNSTFAGR